MDLMVVYTNDPVMVEDSVNSVEQLLAEDDKYKVVGFNLAYIGDRAEHDQNVAVTKFCMHHHILLCHYRLAIVPCERFTRFANSPDYRFAMMDTTNNRKDGKVDHMEYQNVVEEEQFQKRKKYLEESARLEVQLEKLKLAKEHRCILQSQADIVKNTKKANQEVEHDRDLLKKEKAKLDHVANELLKDRYGSKEKLEKIKAILDSLSV
ncbi:hypothetical protein D1007_33779 [Hordeum vulgare]|nr:hypothetical protein D1007_33779 [Hordeum vulgare]